MTTKLQIGQDLVERIYALLRTERHSELAEELADLLRYQSDWEECPCCECYHPKSFCGDCRDDAHRA